jgi:hypothetical protein
MQLAIGRRFYIGAHFSASFSSLRWQVPVCCNAVVTISG